MGVKPNVLVLFKANLDDRKIIEKHLSNIANITYYHDLNKKDRVEYLERADVILTGSGREITEEIARHFKKLKFLQTLAAGLDRVPFKLLREDVIVASNAGGNAEAVAEHALGLILSALKYIPLHDRNMRSGKWLRRKSGLLLKGKKVGIIGLGKIGRELAKIVMCLGARILAVNRSGRTDMKVDFIGTLNDLEFVLKESDIIVISLPLTKKTANLINEKELKLVKKNVILVNIARGEIIQEKALYTFLKENKDAIAALDVWWNYPSEPEGIAFQHYPFHELDNVIMTPHIAGFSPDIRDKVMESAVLNIKKFLQGKKPDNVANRQEYV